MNLSTINGIGTTLILIAFSLLVWWLFKTNKKSDFENSRIIPFKDGPEKDSDFKYRE